MANVRLELEGMTCAACAGRIGKALNDLDGVEASVNFATEQAAVRYDEGASRSATSSRAVESAGYGASLTRAEERPGPDTGLRLAVAAALTAPVVLLAMIPPFQFTGWEWVALALDGTRVGVGRLAVPSRRASEPAPRRRHHGHARLARHDRRVRLVGRRAARRRRHRRLLRGRGRDHDTDPARPLAREPRAPPLERRAPRPPGVGCEGRARAQGRCRGAPARRAGGSRRPLRGAPGREGGDRRRRRRGRLGRRPVDADRRAGARGRGAGRRGRGRDRQLLRTPRRARDARRRRHRARADRGASSPRHRPARPPSSAWRTASPRCSSRS